MKIKLFTTLILFALVITIGGVYATWTFASGDTNVTAAGTITKSNLTHGGEVSSANVGGITIDEDPADVLAVVVTEMVGEDTNGNGTIDEDEKFDKNGDGVPDSVSNYIPVATPDGQIIVTFTPDQTAPAEYKDGVSLTCTLTAAEGSAFEFASNTLALDANSETNYGIAYTYDSVSGTCTWVVEAADLGISFVEAYEDNPITTYADYTEFSAAVAKQLKIEFFLVTE